MPSSDSAKPGAREAAAQDKTDRILTAATALFAERGFHGTAVPEVAKKAGVGAGTIYRYFENKEALVNAVFCRAKSHLKEYLFQDLILNQNSDLREVFHRFWWNLVKFAQENPVEFHFLELQDHAPYLDDDSRNLEREVLAPIWLLGVQACEKGVAGDMPADTMIAMVWGSFVGIMKAQVLGYLTVSEALFSQAEEACWKMITR